MFTLPFRCAADQSFALESEHVHFVDQMSLYLLDKGNSLTEIGFDQLPLLKVMKQTEGDHEKHVVE